MKPMKFIGVILLTFSFLCMDAQTEEIYGTFKDRNIVNTRTVETLPKRKLDIRIGHKFGDLAGDNGGWENFYGLENASDIMIGADYGITDNLTVGFNRTKGAGPLKQLLNGSLKYKFIRQKNLGSTPVSMALVGVLTYSTMKKTDIVDAINFFEKSTHRMVYNAQLLIARKFSNAFSIQVAPGYTHRNIVALDDENGIFSLAMAARIQLTKNTGLIIDYTVPFSDVRTPDNSYYHPFGIGFEFETGGHIFQLNFTNATGIMETDYIPNTRTNWSDGEFRMGFTISRLFNL